MGYGHIGLYVKNISKIKFEQFAEEARSLDAPHLKAMRDKEKRYSLIACLLAQAQASAKDGIVQTFSLCLHSAEKEAQRQYAGSNQKRNGLMEDVVQFVLNVTTGYKKTEQRKLSEYLKKSYQNYGGTNKVIDDCEKILAKPSNKHIPYMWKPYKSNRYNVYNFINAVSLDAIKQKQCLLKAVKLCQHFYDNKYNDIWYTLKRKMDLSFIPRNWRDLVVSGVVE